MTFTIFLLLGLLNWFAWGSMDATGRTAMRIWGTFFFGMLAIVGLFSWVTATILFVLGFLAAGYIGYASSRS